MITCRHFVSIITDEQEGALSLTERAAFHLHRTICPPCRGYLDSFGRTVELLHEAPAEAEPAPEAMRAALLARLRAGKSG
jgi:hypothetical protein